MGIRVYIDIIQCHQHMFEMSKKILRSPYVSNKTIKHFQLFAYFLLQVSSFSFFFFSKKGYAKLRQVNFYMTLFDCIWHFCLKLRFTAFYFTTLMYSKISSALFSFLIFLLLRKEKRISMRIFSPLRLSPCYHRLVCAISQQSCFMSTQTIHSNLFSIFCVWWYFHSFVLWSKGLVKVCVSLNVYGWVWMCTTDYGWVWLTMDGFDWLWMYMVASSTYICVF